MNDSPLITPHYQPDSAFPFQEFFATLKRWLGRLCSTIGNLSFKLHQLITKTQQAVDPIFDQANSKGEPLPTTLLKAKIVSSIPLQETTTSTSLLTDETSPSNSSEVFQTTLSSSLKEQKNEEGVKPLNENKEQIPYSSSPLPLEEAATASFESHKSKEPEKTTQEDSKNVKKKRPSSSEEKIQNLKKVFKTMQQRRGQTLQGITKSKPDHINDLQPAKETRDKPQRLYEGDLKDEKPHGSGKLVLSSSEGFKHFSGKFENGQFVEGTLSGKYQGEDNGIVFKGNFNSAQNSFKGEIRDSKNQSVYVGEMQDGYYHGTGTLTMLRIHKDEIIQRNELMDLIIVTPKTIRIIVSGKFDQGKIIHGEEKIYWNDGKYSVGVIQKGKIINTIIQIPQKYEDEKLSGCKFEGEFDFCSLKGRGRIYKPDGKLLYQGEIEYGYPHGQGELIGNNGQIIKKGCFKYGKYSQLRTNSKS